MFARLTAFHPAPVSVEQIEGDRNQTQRQNTMRNRPVKAIATGLGRKVAGQKIGHCEQHNEAIHNDATGVQFEGAVDDENGEEQVSGVVAIVEIGEKEAEKNEVQTFDADARFDEKNLVDETNRVG